jgi:hypothetical protein
MATLNESSNLYTLRLCFLRTPQGDSLVILKIADATPERMY